MRFFRKTEVRGINQLRSHSFGGTLVADLYLVSRNLGNVFSASWPHSPDEWECQFSTQSKKQTFLKFAFIHKLNLILQAKLKFLFSKNTKEKFLL